mmetsp:Transcript_7970/g.19238  ORF Transcript_7970/g.19238 Transcript_7970/m.19238 type:complete len:416 (-) Transcript_7970:213-1460(-)
MTVAVVLVDIGGSLSEVLSDEFGHSGRHALRNVHNDASRLFAQFGKDTVALVELLKQASFVRFADSVHRPSGVGKGRFVEIQQVLDLDLVAGKRGHVVLDRVQSSEDEVKDEDVNQHCRWQLSDDGRKTARDLDQNFITKCQVIRIEDLADVGRVEVGFQRLDVQKREGRKDLVDVRELLGHGFLVGLDLSVRALLFALIAFDFLSKEWPGLATSTEMFFRGIKAMNRFQVNVLVGSHGLFQILPPVIQQPLFADEPEPRRKQQRFVFHHFDEDLTSDPFHVVNLVGVTLDGKIGLRRDNVEKDIVDFVFSPRTIRSVCHGIGSPVMKTCQKLELVDVQFRRRNAELVIQLSNSGILGSHHGSIGDIFRCVDFGWFHSVERVRAACIGPDIGEGNLRRSPLLQEKFSGRFIKDKD